MMLNDPTRGIDVGTKQELYPAAARAGRRRRVHPLLHNGLRRADRLLRPRARPLPEPRAGASSWGPTSPKRTSWTWPSVCAAGLSARGADAEPAQIGGTMKDWKLRLRQNQGLLVARWSVHLVLRALLRGRIPRASAAVAGGGTTPTRSFVLVAGRHGARPIPVLTGGLDLSVGAVITLVNCVASRRPCRQRAVEVALGILLVPGRRAVAAGLLNGC